MAQMQTYQILYRLDTKRPIDCTTGTYFLTETSCTKTEKGKAKELQGYNSTNAGVIERDLSKEQLERLMSSRMQDGEIEIDIDRPVDKWDKILSMVADNNKMLKQIIKGGKK